MIRLRYLSLLCLFATAMTAQSPVDVGGEGAQTTYDEANTGADRFATEFPEENTGLLHVYIDTMIDPLETYLMRGEEMTDAAMEMLPSKFRRKARNDRGTYYAVRAVKGIEENLYITRFDGPRRDQIDMFAIRDGKIKHLRTLAYRDCGGGECLQMDAYLSDFNRDTDLDLVTIARRSTDRLGTTDERRRVYYMPADKRSWVRTERMEIPWNAITFWEEDAEPDQPADDQRQ